jgi:salicylate hydroxylase
MTKKPRVALIGGGLGGMTAALALSRFGFEPHVFEQAGELREIGAGVGVGPNAVKVFRALGLEEDLRSRGFEAGAIVGRDLKTSEIKFQVPMKGASESRYGAAHVQIHRADLLDMLVRAATGVRVRLNSHCVAVSSSDGAAKVTLSDGREESFDVVIGCDGLHSVARAGLYGPDSPRFTGNMCWRALIATDQLPPDLVQPNMTVWIGPDGHIVTYYVRGGRMVNLVAFLAVEHQVRESWSNESTAGELLAAYPEAHPQLRAVMERATNCVKWGLFDREPLPSWHKGRVTLLGDAAHPMLPFLGQGAATAIEDGYVFARELARSPDDVVAALRAYEGLRIPRTARIQIAARKQERFVHQTTRSADVNSDWLYQHDVTQPDTAEAS